MALLILFTALFSLFIALGVIWFNPKRFSNQVFSVVSIIQALWLACVYYAIEAGDHIADNGSHALEFWLRGNAIVISLLPWALWLLKGAIEREDHSRFAIFNGTTSWLALGMILIILVQHDSFLTRDEQGHMERGIAYYLYSFILFGACGSCVIQTARRLHLFVGIARVELQFLALTTGITALTLAAFNAAGNFLELRFLNRGGVLIVFLAYAVMGGALIFHKIYNARQLFTFLAHRIVLLSTLCFSVVLLNRLFQTLHLDYGREALSVAISCVGVVWLRNRTSIWLGIDPEIVISEQRKAVINVAMNNGPSVKLSTRFEQLINTLFLTTSSQLLLEDKTLYEGRGLKILKNTNLFQALQEHGWVTPESLYRRRHSQNPQDLRCFIEKHSLALIVAIPRASPSPSLILCVGRRINQAPFTYPEIIRLQSVAELMDSILTRSRLTEQAALQAKMEHLAMMTRGLAHDLKNLITPVSSFLIHTEGKFRPESAEAEVHTAARRSVRVMSDYVREALFFSDRLAPKLERIRLPQVFEGVRDATTPRAHPRHIQVTFELQYRDVIVADCVLLQRMLVNLVNNAIDASADGMHVTVSAMPMDARPDWLRFQVIDTGCGIAREHLERVLEPYFTTKEFGDEIRGFGLGMTISQKIAHLHHGTIRVESRLGEGTTITVDLPSSPPEPSAKAKASLVGASAT